MATRCLAVVLAATLVVGCGGEATQGPGDDGVISGGLVDVGGHRLSMECMGAGSPTVVLEAGFGGTTSNWAGVLADLGRTTQTCAYDRAGLGASDSFSGTRDAGDEVADLQRLLAAARMAPPYVLVGHSYGGLLVRLFAHDHPDETGGVVLVDAEGRDAWRRGRAAWPPWLAPELRRRSDFLKPVVDGVDTRASAALASGIRSLGATPLVVITAARERELFRGAPPTLYRRSLRLWRVMQTELAQLLSDQAHVVALRSDHFVQDDQPLAVVRAVRAVVGAVRDHTELPPCARLFPGPDFRCLG